jgi:hypothetical protein
MCLIFCIFLSPDAVAYVDADPLLACAGPRYCYTANSGASHGLMDLALSTAELFASSRYNCLLYIALPDLRSRTWRESAAMVGRTGRHSS